MPGDDATVVLGSAPNGPMVAGTFPTGVINGLLRDVRVFEGALSRARISEIMQESKPDREPDLQINGPWCVDDPQRPISHAQPPRAWTNEPHGLVHWRGQYHLFYQKNPNGPYWGHIHWGHLTSPDLRRWTEMPIALTPEPGPDSDGCWSGSVIAHDGKIAIIYTGGDGSRSSICLALSDDGIQFNKYRGNPIIPQPPNGFPEFRDPFVWREGDTYYLIIGSAVKDVGGTALLYRSKDLLTWEYRKPIHSGHHEDSGTFWEMPIFVKVGSYYVLIVCEVPGRASYWVGSWEDETFTPISAAPQRLELFNHFLSPTPMIGEDGQVTAMGIIPDERRPKETWAAGWAHLYSLPRSLSTDADGHLLQKPREVIERWCEPLAVPRNIDLREGSVHELDNIAEKSFRVRVTLKRGESQSVSLLVRRSPSRQEQTEILYEWASGVLTLERSKSSLDPMVRRDRKEAAYVTAEKDSIHLDVIVDRSVVEVFVDGRAAFAARIYPTLDDSNRVAFATTGTGAKAKNLSLARIGRPG
jgi:beta-fructofuranosidase